jgi:uncharacterized membrane protein
MAQKNTIATILFMIAVVLSVIGVFLSFWRRSGLGFAAIVTPLFVLFFGGWVAIIVIRNRNRKLTKEEFERSVKTYGKRLMIYRIIYGSIVILAVGVPGFIFFINDATLTSALLTLFGFGFGAFLIIGSKFLARLEIKILCRLQERMQK